EAARPVRPAVVTGDDAGSDPAPRSFGVRHGQVKGGAEALPGEHTALHAAPYGSYGGDGPVRRAPPPSLRRMPCMFSSPVSLSRRHLFLAGALGVTALAGLGTAAPAKAADPVWTEEFMTRPETRRGFDVEAMDPWQIDNARFIIAVCA